MKKRRTRFTTRPPPGTRSLSSSTCDAPGRSVNHESVSNWFNEVTYILLGESRDSDGETVHVNKPEIMIALAFIDFNKVKLDYRLSIIPDNWMAGLFRNCAEAYTKRSARHLANN